MVTHRRRRPGLTVGAAHVTPQAELAPGAMADLMALLRRDDLPVVVQCAIAHAQFETIHPFIDGNDRCGRALAHAMCSTITPPVCAAPDRAKGSAVGRH